MVWALILAAGEGKRLISATGGIPKQFLEWHTKPLYWHSAYVFAQCARIEGIVFVFPSDSIVNEQRRVETLMHQENLGIQWKAVAGGRLRQDSVRHGLAVLPENATYVLVHDAARSFVTSKLVNRVLDKLIDLQGSGGVVPGLAVTDTLKVVREGVVKTTPDRDSMVAVQTPQGFRTAELRQSHEEAVRQSWNATDDAMLLERCGFSVHIVAGERSNRKITSPEDLEMLREISPCSLPRVGFGYDVHKYAHADTDAQKRPMRLGGVLLPDGPDVLAHSDGDVLLHALTDALLGCLGAGDIGQRFPDTDAAFENMNSAIFLDDVLEECLQAGMRLTHVDLTLIAQIPKIGPYRDAIRKNVARLLRCELSAINVKATTEEGLGFTGSKEGIKAVAVVTMVGARFL